MLFEAPEQVRQIKEMGILYDMTDTIGQQLEHDVESVKQNLFFTTATEEKIAEYETILQLKKSSTDTLEDRRFRVKSKVFQMLPYTMRVLKRYLDSICGDNNYHINVNVENFTLTCLISEKYKRYFSDIVRLLDDIVPVNVFINVIVRFISFGQLLIGSRQVVTANIIVSPYVQKQYDDIANVFTGALTSNIALKTSICTKGEKN